MRKERHNQSALYRYLLGGICVILLLYTTIQYLVFTNTYHQSLFKEAAQIDRLFQDILENYKAALEKLSYEIKEQNLYSDKKGIEDLLKKAYAYGIDDKNRGKIRTSGLNWVGVEGAELIFIGRLGELKHPLDFPLYYLKKLENKREGFESADILAGEDFSRIPLINIGKAIRDKRNKYRGFVNARVDLETLKDTLISTNENGLHFILVNHKGDELLSSLPKEASVKKSRGMSELLQDISKGNFFEQRIIFPLQIHVHDFPYILRFGYDQNHFYLLFFKHYYLPFLLFFSCVCFFAFFSYLYHKKFIKRSLNFYKETSREKNLTIDRLTKDNHQLTEREKSLENLIKSSEMADKEEKKFCLEIHGRISYSLSKMLDIANFLLTRIQEENNIKDDSKELMEVFEHTYIHSRFFTLKQEEELVSLNDVLNEVLIMFSKQVIKKELQIKIPHKEVIAIVTDRTALKQTLVNILGRSIKNSPRKRDITLNLFSRGEEVLMECKDNGYLGEQQSASEEKNPSLNCMALELPDLEKLVKSLGGSLSTFYKPYEGNTFLLHLPYQARKLKNERDKKRIIADNIVSFSALKKKREP